MEYLTSNSTEFIIWLGVLVVLVSAMSRFNNPQVILNESSEQQPGWLNHLRNMISLKPAQQNLLLRPPRANTTAFRYRLYQFLYGLLAVLVYFLVWSQPEISKQIQEIMHWFVPSLPEILDPGPLVIAAFVILILPNIPPFRWADINIRIMLYDRALIPAQQIREMNRLKIAAYDPPDKLVEHLRELAVAEGFDYSDIAYDASRPTTQSLWSKCAILIEQIKKWEADDHYKTAFAALKEPSSEIRSVDAVKEMQQNLFADARVCFEELRMSGENKSEALMSRETLFRSNCRNLLMRIYSLLAGVSLHSHYSDNDRIIQFGKLGFQLKPGEHSPIPNSNDMLILTIILCVFLVLPLSYKLGLVKALMIGAVMLTSVLSPVVLAHICPRMRDNNSQQHAPNVIYPLLSGVLAALTGFFIFYVGGQFIESSTECAFTGFERYSNCTYPWSYLHAGIALLLAIRLGTGMYPDINLLQGIHRYRQWGDLKDAAICALGMLVLTIFFVLPELEKLNPDRFMQQEYWIIPLRITLVSFVLGFIVPTWYRAQIQFHKVNRRKDLKQRTRFTQELDLKRRGVENTTIVN